MTSTAEPGRSPGSRPARARALAGLTPSVTSASPIAATPTLDPALIYDLPLVRNQLDVAAAAGVGHLAPREESNGFDSTLAAAGTAGAWAYNHTAVPLVNGVADVVQAGAEHAEDMAQLALGAGMMALGAGMMALGAAGKWEHSPSTPRERGRWQACRSTSSRRAPSPVG